MKENNYNAVPEDYEEVRDRLIDKYAPKENMEETKNTAYHYRLLQAWLDDYYGFELSSKVTEDAEYEIVEPKKAFDENVLDFMNVGDDLRKAVYNAHSLDVYNGFKELVEPIKIDNNKTEQK